MTSEYVFGHWPDPHRDDSTAVLINLWRAPSAERQSRFADDMIDAVWGPELGEGEVSFGLFLSEDGRDLLAYKQWTSKETYDVFMSERGFGGAAAFKAANPDVEFWHDWFTVDATGPVHTGLTSPVRLGLTIASDHCAVEPLQGVPLAVVTRFRLLRSIERPV